MIQIGAVYITFCQEEGILLQKDRDRHGRFIAIGFKSIGVRGQFDSPAVWSVFLSGKPVHRMPIATVKAGPEANRQQGDLPRRLASRIDTS